MSKGPVVAPVALGSLEWPPLSNIEAGRLDGEPQRGLVVAGEEVVSIMLFLAEKELRKSAAGLRVADMGSGDKESLKARREPP